MITFYIISKHIDCCLANIKPSIFILFSFSKKSKTSNVLFTFRLPKTKREASCDVILLYIHATNISSYKAEIIISSSEAEMYLEETTCRTFRTKF